MLNLVAAIPAHQKNERSCYFVRNQDLVNVWEYLGAQIDRFAPGLIGLSSGAMSTTACPRCGRSFDCGAQDSSKPCWCVSLPALPLEELGRQDAGCYCPDCLRTRLAERAVPGQEKP